MLEVKSDDGSILFGLWTFDACYLRPQLLLLPPHILEALIILDGAQKEDWDVAKVLDV